jgi:glycosyltransferase involved in cell wall biosynthesis
MIEGMATGVPVVSFDVCSAAEMLTATGAGIVVPQGDHIGLAGALAELAQSPDRRAAMGGRGRAAAEQRFDPLAVAARYRQLYAEVLAG